MRWPAERSQEALDGLLVLARAAVLSTTGERVPGVVVELLEALAADVSADGNAVGGGGSMDAMGMGLTADEAGSQVGLTGARVRQLCRAGLVRHELLAGRYLVDVDDLRRHLTGGAA